MQEMRETIRGRATGLAIGLCFMPCLLSSVQAREIALTMPIQLSDPLNKIGSACDKPTTRSECFNADRLIDRVIFCANKGLSYLFMPDNPSGRLDQYCRNTEQEKNDLTKDSSLHEELRKSFHLGRDQVCKSNDVRRASGLLVADIVSDPQFRPGLVGLRLLGGIYCDKLILREMSTKYSIVLDASVFFDGAYVRNVTIGGDLSLESTQVAEPIQIWRSRIEGGLFALQAIIEAIGIKDQ